MWFLLVLIASLVRSPDLWIELEVILEGIRAERAGVADWWVSTEEIEKRVKD